MPFQKKSKHRHNIYRPKQWKMSLANLRYSQCSECRDRTVESVYATTKPA